MSKVTKLAGKLEKTLRIEEDLEEEFDVYMDGVLNAVIDEYDADEDEAVDYIIYVADDLAEEGLLPPFPTEDSSTEEVSAWLAAAESSGFAGMVLDSWE